MKDKQNRNNRTESKTDRNSEQKGKKIKDGGIEIKRKERTKQEGRRKEENA